MITSKSCRVFGIQTESILAYIVAGEVVSDHNLVPVLTSCTDGIHGAKSLHYVGHAIDVSCTSAVGENEARDIADEMAANLTPEYDVVPEFKSDGSLSHWHIEYQPKSWHRS